MDYSSRELRLSSTMRGILFMVLVAGYAWFSRQPATSLVVGLLIAAGLQIVVIGIRRFVSADRQPQALYVFEIVVDGATLLLFAVGIFGGIHRFTTSV